MINIIIHSDSEFRELFSLTVLFVAECKVVDGTAHYHLNQLQGSDRDRDYLRDPIPDIRLLMTMTLFILFIMHDMTHLSALKA